MSGHEELGGGETAAQAGGGGRGQTSGPTPLSTDSPQLTPEQWGTLVEIADYLLDGGLSSFISPKERSALKAARPIFGRKAASK